MPDPSSPSKEAREVAKVFAKKHINSKPHGNSGNEIVWLGDRLTLPMVDHPGQTAVSVVMMRNTLEPLLARALDAHAEKVAKPLREERDCAEREAEIWSHVCAEAFHILSEDITEHGVEAAEKALLSGPGVMDRWAVELVETQQERDQLRERVAELEKTVMVLRHLCAGNEKQIRDEQARVQRAEGERRE